MQHPFAHLDHEVLLHRYVSAPMTDALMYHPNRIFVSSQDHRPYHARNYLASRARSMVRQNVPHIFYFTYGNVGNTDTVLTDMR